MPKTHFASSHRPEQYRASRPISMLTALVVVVFFISSMSARAQSAAGAGASSSVTPKYCADHPTDSAKCLPPIPPGASAEFSDGVPPLPKPQPTPPTSTAPVTVPAPPTTGDPQQVIDQFKAQAAKDEAATKAETAPVQATPALTWQAIQRQINEQNEQDAIQEQQNEQQNEADRERLEQQQQAQEQQNYQSGQQMGAAAGTLIVILIERHRMKSYCKKHPSGSWQYPSGRVVACPAK